MIKILIKNKKSLNESLKISTSGLKNVLAFLDSTKSNAQDQLHKFSIPYSEVSFENDSILNGLVLTHLINSLGKNNNSLKDFEKYWDNDRKSFSDALIKKIKSLSFNGYVKAIYSKTPPSIGGKFTAKTAVGSTMSLLKITVYMNNSFAPEDLEATVVHELQHFTQYINQLSRDYNEQLKKVKTFSDIVPIKIEDLVITVGIGRDPTGIKYSKNMSLKDYYISDDEYETYLTSMVNTCYHYIVKNNDFNPSTESVSSYVSNFIKRLVTEKTFARNVFSTLGIRNTYDIFESILKARKKELIKDLYIDLQKRL